MSGIRGLSALYVMLFHIILTGGVNTDGLPWLFKAGIMATSYGHVSVGIFIVLSGCCLMIPVARAADGRFAGGILQFFKQRSWRILPPYYAALIFSVLYALASIHLKNGVSTEPSAENAHTLTTAFVTHVLMIHDLRADWKARLNSPMWSTAVVWQIYFVYALILLPIWRRFGNRAVLVVAFVLGYLPHALLPMGHNFDWARPWYVGLFTMGMVTANAMHPRDGKFTNFTKVPWAVLGVLSLAVVAVCLHFIPHQDWVYDPAIGFMGICIMAHCWQASQPGSNGSPLLRLLNHRWAVLLGDFSFSLYLTHRPVQFFIAMIGHKLHLDHTHMLLLLWATVPVVLLCAYGFFLVFEKPFASSKRRIALLSGLKMPERFSTIPSLRSSMILPRMEKGASI